MKPFNIEEAKAGKPVITRGGRDVRILCFDCKTVDNAYPIAGLWENRKGFEEFCIWSNKGEFLIEETDLRDLFMKSEKKEGWLNIYKEGTCGLLYDTEEEATERLDMSLCPVATVKVEWEE